MAIQNLTGPGASAWEFKGLKVQEFKGQNP
jgi:hypothetical protein